MICRSSHPCNNHDVRAAQLGSEANSGFPHKVLDRSAGCGGWYAIAFFWDKPSAAARSSIATAGNLGERESVPKAPADFQLLNRGKRIVSLGEHLLLPGTAGGGEVLPQLLPLQVWISICIHTHVVGAMLRTPEAWGTLSSFLGYPKGFGDSLDQGLKRLCNDLKIFFCIDNIGKAICLLCGEAVSLMPLSATASPLGGSSPRPFPLSVTQTTRS